MNEIILFAEVFLMFSALLMAKRFFGKEGLFVWIGLASALANVQVVKSVDLLGVSATVGNVLFASVFLATDLLRECYGKEEAKKGVYVGTASIIVFLICSQITLAYAPNGIDVSHGAMETLFSLSLRVCLASLSMYVLANVLDVYIYDKLYRRFDGKKMWVRNNVSTVLCNCVENFGFTILAFAGMYSTKDLLAIAFSTCLIEAVIAMCDTPFLYIGKKL